MRMSTTFDMESASENGEEINVDEEMGLCEIIFRETVQAWMELNAIRILGEVLDKEKSGKRKTVLKK